MDRVKYLLVYFLFLLKFVVGTKNAKNVENDFNPGFIIRLYDSKSHNDFYDRLSVVLNVSNHQLRSIIDIKYEYYHVYHGLYIKPTSLLSIEMLQDKRFHDFIQNVQYDKKMAFYKYSWGLDRIDQFTLPLDGVYYPTYTGLGVDVYIIDSGLDTLHSEFQGNPNRVVKNIYDGNVDDQNLIDANNDENGHGTHCAGTIGGNTVGVARDANIYALRGNDSEGAFSSYLIKALDFVYDYSKINVGNPAVISMSLGSYCGSDCSTDASIVAVQNITNRGFFTVVAAGNEACDACRTTPAAAYNTITVGATDKNDNIAEFSNYGECVDIFAPGVDIVSAESSLKNGNELTYFEESGTSQATPHVAGVVAQQLQRLKSISSPSELSKILSCESSRNQLQLGLLDTISRNYLLQIPRINNLNDTCNLVNGCANLNFCSGHGVCQLAKPVSVYGNEYNVSNAKETCHCDKSFYGVDCSLTVNPTTNCNSAFIQTITLEGNYSNWAHSSFAVYNRTTGFNYNNVYSSICSDQLLSDQLSFCFQPGEYTFQTNILQTTLSWSFCNSTGGTPTTFEFNIDKNGNCNHVCTNGNLFLLSVDSSSNIYNKVSYDIIYYIDEIQSSLTKLIDASSLSIGDNNNVCLKSGNYTIQYAQLSTNNVNVKFCNIVLESFSFYSFEIDAEFNCRILSNVLSPTLSPSIVTISTFQPTSPNIFAISVIQTFGGNSVSDYNDDRPISDNALIYAVLKCYSFPIYSSSVNDINPYDITTPRNSFNVSYTVSIADNLGISATTLQSQLSNCIKSETFIKNFQSYVQINGPDILLNANSNIANIVIIKGSMDTSSSNTTNNKSSKLSSGKVAAIVIVVLLVCAFIAYVIYKKYFYQEKPFTQVNRDLNKNLLSSYE